MRTLTFFNSKSGVGKTSLVYHLCWMLADMGVDVVAADLDPQANLSTMFLPEERLVELWPNGNHPQTVKGAIEPLESGIGDVSLNHIEEIHDRIGLVVGDLALSGFEDELSQTWPECLDGKPRAFRVQSAFHRLLREAATRRGAQLVLIDVGPNLGAINRAALVASDHVVVPLAPDLFSLQGLHNLGPTLRRWRSEWERRLGEAPPALDLPAGFMKPVGYIVQQHAVRLDRPLLAYQRWAKRIPSAYRQDVLNEPGSAPSDAANDSNCLAMLKHYRSLIPLAQDARKPVFHLLAADGALGAHAQAVGQAGDDFRALARRIAGAVNLSLPNAA